MNHEPPQLLVLSVDTRARVLIAAALALGRRELRRSGTAVPSSFDELLSVLAARPEAAPSGQQRPQLDHNPPLPEPLLVDYREAARRLGISERTLRRRVASGDLRAVRIGRRALLRVSDLREYGTERNVG
jgi:excisionase family DNA binding protein